MATVGLRFGGRTMDISNALTSGNSFANLSLHAAEEVDRRLQGSQPKDQILKDWAMRLSSISGVGKTAGVAFLHSDPDTTDIIARAFDEASNKTVENIADLAYEMKNIIDPLFDHEKTLTENELNIVKSFCLALHRALMAQTLPTPFDADFVDEQFRFG